MKTHIFMQMENHVIKPVTKFYSKMSTLQYFCPLVATEI